MKNPLSGLSGNQLFVIIAIAIGAILLGFWLSYRAITMPKPETTNFTLFTPAQDISPFQLTDSNDQPFTNLSLQGHWTFIYFGFTGCQIDCPATMKLLNNMYQILLQKQQSPMPSIVMVSIDPDNDTTTKLRDYVTGFNPNFQGATGVKSQIQQLVSTLNVVYTKVKTSNGYTMNHNGSLMLIDPSGRLIAVFTSPFDANSLADDYQNIVNSSG